MWLSLLVHSQTPSAKFQYAITKSDTSSKDFETINEIRPPNAHSFISHFHKQAIEFNHDERDGMKLDEMKLSNPNASFNKFYSLGNSVPPNETYFFYLFINFLLCHYFFCLRGTSFNEIETLMKSSLGVALETVEWNPALGIAWDVVKLSQEFMNLTQRDLLVLGSGFQ